MWVEVRYGHVQKPVIFYVPI